MVATTTIAAINSASPRVRALRACAAYWGAKYGVFFTGDGVVNQLVGLANKTANLAMQPGHLDLTTSSFALVLTTLGFNVARQSPYGVFRPNFYLLSAMLIVATIGSDGLIPGRAQAGRGAPGGRRYGADVCSPRKWWTGGDSGADGTDRCCVMPSQFTGLENICTQFRSQAPQRRAGYPSIRRQTSRRPQTMLCNATLSHGTQLLARKHPSLAVQSPIGHGKGRRHIPDILNKKPYRGDPPRLLPRLTRSGRWGITKQKMPATTSWPLRPLSNSCGATCRSFFAGQHLVTVQRPGKGLRKRSPRC